MYNTGRHIYKLIFEQVECTFDNALNLWGLVLQELVKIIMVCCMIEFEYGILHSKH
jgi:hypothetical protein